MNFRNPKRVILPVLCLSILIFMVAQGCDSLHEGVIEELPTLQTDEASPCQDSITYEVTMVPVDVSDYYPEALPYDYAVMVSGSPDGPPPEGCFCNTTRCVTVSFDQTHVDHAGVAIVTGPGLAIGSISHVSLTSAGQYLGYENPYAAPTSSTNTFCNTLDAYPFVVFFNLDVDFPPEDLESAISGGYGICVLDDLPNGGTGEGEGQE